VSVKKDVKSRKFLTLLEIELGTLSSHYTIVIRIPHDIPERHTSHRCLQVSLWHHSHQDFVQHLKDDVVLDYHSWSPCGGYFGFIRAEAAILCQ
jgi:hypothetical protein